MSSESVIRYRFPKALRTVAVHLSVPPLHSLLKSFYSKYRWRGPDQGAACAISLQREDGLYRLIGPSGDWVAYDEGEAVLYYESELTGALLEDAGAFVHLHGAAVSRGASCLLLIGPSGAGKSTLTLGLCQRGWRALADDALLIDAASDEIQPFDRSIRVHETGLESLGLDVRDVPGARVCRPYLWLSPQLSGADSAGPRRPSALVFLESAGSTLLKRLSAAEALRLLLLARLDGAMRRDFDCLARVAGRVPGCRLTYCDSRDALDELERLACSVPD